MTAEEIAQQLRLLPHPEGGYYREVYRSDGTIPKSVLGDHFHGDRNYCTSIYFLLTSENFSAFHRIQQDEIWHFYSGIPLHVHVIDIEGNYTRHHLGMDLAQGQVPQLVVEAGQWFASSVSASDAYSLVGCTVAPGFDFDDFELADRQALTLSYPQHEAIIAQLTRG